MNTIKEVLKRNKIIRILYKNVNALFQSILTIISPTLNSKYHYRKVFNKKLDLKKPSTFNEKLLWLKLKKYNNDPLVAQCADKYAVRDYVKKCGYENMLNELYGAYERINDIPWEQLPNQFALKWNFGCGFNIICRDKTELDITATKKRLKKWRKAKPYLQFSEMQYKGVKKLLICERFLDTNQGFLPYDYKIYCFHGIPKSILVCVDRGNDMKAVFMTPEWEYLDSPSKYGKLDKLPPMPKELGTMLQSAKDLSKKFAFVRIDYYEYKGKAIFGEMTFTPAGCLYTSQTKDEIMPMAQLIEINNSSGVKYED